MNTTIQSICIDRAERDTHTLMHREKREKARAREKMGSTYLYLLHFEVDQHCRKSAYPTPVAAEQL